MRFGFDLPPQLRVYGAFFIYSFILGSVPPRLPEIQRAMGVEEGAFGLSLIGAAVGTLISLTFAGPILERVGFRRALLWLIPGVALAYAIAVQAPTAPIFFMLLLPLGLAIGGVEIIINLDADRVEHQIGRRIMNRAHAFWSFGFFVGGFTGALVAQSGLSPQWHISLVVPIAVLAVMLVLGRYQPARPREAPGGAAGPRFATPNAGIMVLVLFTLSAMLMEGASIDWSGIYMRDIFDAMPFLSGLAVAVGALFQAGTRFFADGFVERYGPVSVARAMVLVLGLGVLLVFFAPAAWVALAGFAAIGMGSAVLFPLAMSAAAQRTDRPSGLNVAALAQTSFVAFLVGPPLLGLIAEHFGIRLSFGIGLPLVVLSFVLAGALSRQARPHSPSLAGAHLP